MKARSSGVFGAAAGGLLLLGCAHTTRVTSSTPPEATLVQIETMQAGADGAKQPPKSYRRTILKAGYEPGRIMP